MTSVDLYLKLQKSRAQKGLVSKKGGVQGESPVDDDRQRFLSSMEQLGFRGAMLGIVSTVMDRFPPAFYRLAAAVAGTLFQINPILKGGLLQDILQSLFTLFKVDELPLVTRWIVQLIQFVLRHYLGLQTRAAGAQPQYFHHPLVPSKQPIHPFIRMTPRF